METEHKRRVRYKGTHPRSYQEKYKELDPEKYQDEVEKIIRSGRTPAGTHIPIMVEESGGAGGIAPARWAMTPRWAMAATPGGCWKSWRGRATCTPRI